jgi:hypothetical protein
VTFSGIPFLAQGGVASPAVAEWLATSTEVDGLAAGTFEIELEDPTDMVQLVAAVVRAKKKR